jgi:inhibitor of KinA sporulation pathway (predicted exonuclease)
VLVVVDLEATCCDDESIEQGRREVIEIGAVLLDDRADILGEFGCFVRPVLHPTLTDFCRRLTGIRQDWVDAADPFQYAGRALCAWYRSGARFCSWGRFDSWVLRLEWERRGEDPPGWLGDCLDLSTYYRRQYRRRAGHNRALRQLGIEREGPIHRALYDARSVAKIIPHLSELQDA